MKKDMKIKERTYQFALEIIKLTRKMPKDTTGFVLGNQLMKSGTSVGANVEEATGAYSKDDFTYKMSLALKEARESNYWLRLLRDSGIIKNTKIDESIKEAKNLKNILSAIVKTSKEGKGRKVKAGS